MIEPQKIRLFIPSRFRFINLKECSEGYKRHKIEENHGKLVLINDSHYRTDEYVLARLRFDYKDNQCYYIQMPQENGTLIEVKVNYNGLEGLLVPGATKAFHYDFKITKE